MLYETFDDFARRGSLRLLGTARLLVNDRQIAEDLTQETLGPVYRAWSSIQADTSGLWIAPSSRRGGAAAVGRPGSPDPAASIPTD
jgi:hypothetical protein